MKSVLISIQPKWCELIASGRKTIEVRKTRPKLDFPFKVYIYQSKKRDLEGATYSDGKVIGEFVCNKITSTVYWRLNGQTGRCAKRTEIEQKFPELSCLTLDEIREYAGSNQRIVYGWHISDLLIYEKPKKLQEFHKPIMPTGLRYENDTIEKPPQSWFYVEELSK